MRQLHRDRVEPREKCGIKAFKKFDRNISTVQYLKMYHMLHSIRSIRIIDSDGLAV
jgi:hypothetical protein